MKDFKDKYINFISNIDLSEHDSKRIFKNIVNYKHKRIITVPLVISLSAVILFFGIVYAKEALNKLNVTSMDDIPVENTSRMQIIMDKNDLEIEEKLFVKDEYYTRDEIEGKINCNILKNNTINDNLYKLVEIHSEDSHVAFANFVLVNNDKTFRSTSTDLYYSITLNTKYNSEDYKSWFIGDNDYEYYYIKNIETEAAIIKPKNNDFGLIHAVFEKDKIIYSITVDMYKYNIEFVYKVLDSFTY